MAKRVLTAVFLVIFFAAIVIFRNTVLPPAAVALVSAISAYEALRAYKLSKNIWMMTAGIVYAAAFPFIYEYAPQSARIVALWVIVCIFLLSAILLHKQCSMGQNIPALFLIVAISWTLMLFIDILRIEQGVAKGLFVCLTAWLTDTFAHLVGSQFGKHKLAPTISKNKTVEGAVSGLVGGLLCGIGFGLYMNLQEGIAANYVLTGLFGIVGSVLGQFGDLIASKIKRECGIKDFGTILPGHGGVIDRIDSMLFLIPAGYFLFIVFGYPR